MIQTEYTSILPHIQPLGYTFFVTFNLFGSLPREVINKIKKEHELRQHEIRFSDRSDKDVLLYREQRVHFQRYEEALDKFHGGIEFLKDSQIAQIVADKIHQFDGQYYDLLSYCIMPNHVHMVVDFSVQLHPNFKFLEKEYTQLHKVMSLIKGSTSHQANAILDRRGTHFWQKDSYDHYVRNPAELKRIIKYVNNNPVKAGLVEKPEDWQFTYVASPSGEPVASDLSEPV
jgi:putative transposase